MEWTYYKEGECENTYSPDFYGPCYRDEGSVENILTQVQESLMNRLILVGVREGWRFLVLPESFFAPRCAHVCALLG